MTRTDIKIGDMVTIIGGDRGLYDRPFGGRWRGAPRICGGAFREGDVAIVIDISPYNVDSGWRSNEIYVVAPAGAGWIYEGWLCHVDDI